MAQPLLQTLMGHVRAERLFDAQGHFRRQRGLAVQKIGERGAAHFQNLRRLRHVAESLDDLGLNQVARMRRPGAPNTLLLDAA